MKMCAIEINWIKANPTYLLNVQGFPVIAVGVGLSTYDKASVRILIVSYFQKMEKRQIDRENGCFLF